MTKDPSLACPSLETPVPSDGSVNPSAFYLQYPRSLLSAPKLPGRVRGSDVEETPEVQVFLPRTPVSWVTVDGTREESVLRRIYR